MARKDSPGCLVLAASLLIFIAIPGLIRALLALLHHEAFYWRRVRLLIPTWFNPWQGIIVFGLILGIASYILVGAIRDLRKR
jgi:hypothetical protein